MKKLNKKAFTLIELIVVIAVVGILVLLAAPRFIGQTNTAQDRNIQNDVKVAEMKVSEALIDGLDMWDSWTDDGVTSGTLKTLIGEDGTGTTLYGRGGPIYDENDVEDGGYRVLPETFIKQEIHSRLEGTFYANDNGTVYYESGVVRQGDADKEEPGQPEEPSKPGEKEPVYSDEEIQDLINKGYIPIATADELNSIRDGLDKKYIQVANINLSGYSAEGWTPIGTDSSNFTGTYDGGNYVITGLEVKGEGNSYQGLFGRTAGATIRNVGLIDNKVAGSGYVGGLVGYADNSTISNSYATGSVTGYLGVGGLVGQASDSTIENSYATGLVTGSGDYVGGLMGRAGINTKINNSYAIGSVKGSREGVGGLVGYAETGTISNSYATGPVEGTTEAGGLVGRANFSAKISNSYATGSVKGTGIYVGGLVGGAYNNSKISNSYATGSVTGVGNGRVGGLVGLATSITISNSYSTGLVTGNSLVGGLVGYAVSGTISNSYATGSVEGEEKVGGLVGDANNGTINNSYWNTETTGQSTSAGGVGKSTKDMKKEATYEGWDFETIWKIDEGNDYPKLR